MGAIVYQHVKSKYPSPESGAETQKTCPECGAPLRNQSSSDQARLSEIANHLKTIHWLIWVVMGMIIGLAL